MPNFFWLLLVKGVELLLVVTLYKAYGTASSSRALWAMFCGQSELAQIGTVTCIVMLIALVATSIRLAVLVIGKQMRARKAASSSRVTAPDMPVPSQQS